MADAAPLLTVVVCTRDRAALLDRCLGSLERQTISPEAMEVVVVDNGSTDGTPSLLRERKGNLPLLRAVAETEEGHSQARNRGWREARAPLVAFLDDDAEATPGWAERILLAFSAARAAHPGLRPAAVGGCIQPLYPEPPPPWFEDRLETRSWGRMPGYLEGEAARQGFSGSNMAFPREVLEASGGFSTDYGVVGGKLRMGEDTELFRRLDAAGGRFWYDPGLVVFHRVAPELYLLRNRFLRNVRKGRSQARMDGRRLLTLRSLRGAAGILLSLLLLPFQVSAAWARRTPPRRALAYRLERAGFRLGLLAGARW